MRASVIALMPPDYYRPLTRDLPRYARPEWRGDAPPFIGEPTSGESHGYGDAWVYVTRAVKSPVVFPLHAVHLLRNHIIPGQPLRIVAFPNYDRIGCAAMVVNADPRQQTFDPSDFRARRAASRRTRGR